MLWPGDTGAIYLVVNEWSAVDSPADPSKPTPRIVEAINVTAEVEVGLGLSYTEPVSPHDSDEVFPALTRVCVFVGLAYKAAASISKGVGSYTIRRICDDYIKLVGSCLSNPLEAVCLDESVAVGAEGLTHLPAKLNIPGYLLRAEVRLPRLVEALRTFDVGRVEERGQDDLSPSIFVSSSCRATSYFLGKVFHARDRLVLALSSFCS